MSAVTVPQILVVANRTCPCPGLVDAIHERFGSGDDRGEVRIVAPALNTRLRHFVSDVDGALEQARERLAVVVDSLRRRGIHAEGDVGDADPFLAVGDTLAVFRASEIVVSTHPVGHSNWMEKRLIERLTAAHDVPVTHLVSKYGLAAAA